MNDRSRTSRRRFLKLTGGTMVLIPLVNLQGCGEQEPQRPAERPPAGGQAAAPQSPPPQQPAAAPADQGAGAQAQTGSGDMERLEESNPQAQALGYKHSAEDVDQSAFPRYEPGQLCSTCNLYVEEQGDEQWGGCQIFPGKLVNADGWCSAWVPVA